LPSSTRVVRYSTLILSRLTHIPDNPIMIGEDDVTIMAVTII